MVLKVAEVVDCQMIERQERISWQVFCSQSSLSLCPLKLDKVNLVTLLLGHNDGRSGCVIKEKYFYKCQL